MEYAQHTIAKSTDTSDVARLVVSYQRYAALVFGIIAGLLWSASVLGTGWAWGVAAALSLGLGWFGTLVALRLPHKLRLTRTQDERIRRNKFEADDLLLWVEDPCYRVVAREILVRAGRSPQQARTEVSQLAERAAASEGLVFYSKPPSVDGAHAPPESERDAPDSRSLDEEDTR